MRTGNGNILTYFINGDWFAVGGIELVFGSFISSEFQKVFSKRWFAKSMAISLLRQNSSGTGEEPMGGIRGEGGTH